MVLCTLLLCVVLAFAGYASNPQHVPVPKEAVTEQRMQLAAEPTPPTKTPTTVQLHREIETKTLELKPVNPAKSAGKPAIAVKPKASEESAVSPGSAPKPNPAEAVTLVGREGNAQEVYPDGRVRDLGEQKPDSPKTPDIKSDDGRKEPDSSELPPWASKEEKQAYYRKRAAIPPSFTKEQMRENEEQAGKTNVNLWVVMGGRVTRMNNVHLSKPYIPPSQAHKIRERAKEEERAKILEQAEEKRKSDNAKPASRSY